MFLALLRPKDPAAGVGRTLHAGAVAQARSIPLYARHGAPDTVEGRFELLTLHVILLVERLSGGGAEVEASRQALFDAYVSDLDGALREMGVGDLVVGKRMRALGAAFYGRAAAYDAAFAALPDRSLLEALIGRTVLAGADGAGATGLAGYVLDCRLALANCSIERLLEAGAPWPAP